VTDIDDEPESKPTDEGAAAESGEEAENTSPDTDATPETEPAPDGDSLPENDSIPDNDTTSDTDADIKTTSTSDIDSTASTETTSDIDSAPDIDATPQAETSESSAAATVADTVSDVSDDDTLRRGLELLADGLLAGLLTVLVIRSVLGPRPLELPTGASSAGVVLLGALAFGCGAILSVRGTLVDCGPRWPIDGLIASGTVLISSLVAFPFISISLPMTALLLGLIGLGAFVAAGALAIPDRELLARRGVASVVDGLLALVIWHLFLHELLPATGTPAPTGATWSEVVTSLLLLPICSAFVRFPFEAFDGRSIGKHLAGLHVVDETGESPDAGAVAIRNLLRPVDSLPIGYVVGIALIGADDQAKRFGDVVAGTRVERVS
jgi:uncharacterized RDD family membrane protein YckC